MPGYRFCSFLFLVVLLFSCEADNKTSLLTYPSVYHKSGFEAVGNLRVFSSTGEINNRSIVSRFNQYDTSYFNSYANYINSDPKIMDTVDFVNGQDAMLHHESKYLDCLLEMESDLLILTEIDVNSRCCNQGEVLTRSLPYYMCRVKPEVHSEFLYSSTGGNYRFGFTGRRKYVLQESDGRLVAPLILYNLHSKNFESGFVNNFLQPDFYSILTAGDTVTLREYQLLFEK